MTSNTELSEFWKKHKAHLQPYVDDGYVFTFSNFSHRVRSVEHGGRWISHVKWQVRHQGRYAFGYIFKPYFDVTKDDLIDMLDEVKVMWR